MTTPRPAVSVLCLALLFGLRAGARALPVEEPVQAKVSASSDDVRSELETLGYRYDEPGRRYIASDGKVLSPQRLRAYLAPFDYRRHDISEEERTGMLLDGYRLEPATGHVLSPETHKPITNLDYESHRVSDSADERRGSLERLNALLDAQDPAQSMTPLARLQAERLLKNRQLPALLAQDVASLTKLAGAVASDVHDAYLDETSAYDGKLDAQSLSLRGLPLAAASRGDAVHAYFDASEKALGQALQRATIAHLERNPVGAEVLGRFKDASGGVKLPAMVILPIDSGAAAIYAGGIVAISQKEFVESLVAKAPASRRAALRSQLRDSLALARYLNAHPGAIEGFLKENDSIIAHELTHAWQHRRDKFWAETERENFPDADYVECEHEAFLVEMRYVHEKLKADPAALANDDDTLEVYQRFVADLDGWRDQITAEYLEGWPQEAATLKTGEELQQERVKAAQELEKNPILQAIEKLKIAAFGVGSAEEKSYKSGYDKLFDDFRSSRYPALQKESRALLARTYLIKARSARDSSDLRYDLDKAMAYARASGDLGLIQETAAALRDKAPGELR